ncbi:MAG TPA: GNAT family N-acetyltransferase [Candidatus Dojkabacteria bacterium]|nr:GNAT family N-acetyltransferase [Candidatus Dojkabacteria bacterium]
MDELILEFPTYAREKDAKEYIDELRSSNSQFNGCDDLEKFEDYREWVDRVIDWNKGVNLPNDYAQAITYFVVRAKDNKIIGMVNIRYGVTKENIKKGVGHIGSGVRPTERKKGYGTEILRICLEECKKYNLPEIHLNVREENISAIRTIEKNKGKLNGEIEMDNGEILLNYIIILEN